MAGWLELKWAWAGGGPQRLLFLSPTLVGRLEMEWACARVIPWGVPHWGHLGRIAGAGVGLGWGQSQEVLHQGLHGKTAGAGSGTSLGVSGGILHLRLPW